MDMSDCPRLSLCGLHKTQASEPLGDFRKHSLLLSSVERSGQGTEPPDTHTRLCSSWKPNGHSLLSLPCCGLTHLTHADTQHSTDSSPSLLSTEAIHKFTIKVFTECLLTVSGRHCGTLNGDCLRGLSH